jgi:hypothetical protein
VLNTVAPFPPLDFVHIFVKNLERQVMPNTDVYFYAETDGSSPVVDWFDTIPEDAVDKLYLRVQQLEQFGYQLRRPYCDLLRDGIYELRVKVQRVHYRLLYFFHEHDAVIAHGCTKEGKVDDADIDRAIRRRTIYFKDPEGHRYGPDED